MTDHYDIIIAGAGPAGSSAAIRLAQAGFKCLIIEKAEFPRHKLCGEFVSPECLPLLNELGIALDAVSPAKISRTTFYSSNGSSFTIPSGVFGTGGQAIGLSRKSLDTLLLDRAKAVGSSFRAGSVTGVERTDEVSGLRVKMPDGSQTRFTADIYLDATGRTRAIARHLGPIRNKQTVRADKIALKAHIRKADVPADACEIYAFRGGYGGCNAVEDGLHNVCFIVSADAVRAAKSDHDKIFRTNVLSNRRAAEVLASSVAETDWLAVPIESYGRFEPVPAGNVLAIGDASAFIDPFTGSGILMALQSARLAAEIIIENGTENIYETGSDHEERHRSLMGTRLKVSAAFRLAAFSPMLGNAVVACLARSPWLASSLARSTRGGAR